MTLLSRVTFQVSRACHGASLLSGVLALAACGSDGPRADDPQARASALSTCRHDLLEPDLEVEPLAGPGVDPATGSLRPAPNGGAYVVSATYGVPRPGADGAPVSPRYAQLFAAIETQLSRETGLLALQLGTSASCGSGRTLAVWKSEEQMYAFVTSPAHLAAMAAARDILMPGYAVTHWEAHATEQISMEEAVRRLGRADDDRAP